MVLDKDGTKVDIVGIILGTVDNHRTDDAEDVFYGVVSVIPGGTVEICAEAVGEGLSGSDRTLLNSGDTIHIGLWVSYVEMRGHVLYSFEGDHANELRCLG